MKIHLLIGILVLVFTGLCSGYVAGDVQRERELKAEMQEAKGMQDRDDEDKGDLHTKE